MTYSLRPAFIAGFFVTLKHSIPLNIVPINYKEPGITRLSFICFPGCNTEAKYNLLNIVRVLLNIVLLNIVPP